MHAVTLDVSAAIATITMNRPESYNALTAQDYDDITEALRAIDKRRDVLVTVWQANGVYFCAGTDVGASDGSTDADATMRQLFLQKVARANTDLTHALYTHSKILVAALNGPVLGIAAGGYKAVNVISPTHTATLAMLGQFDFIYALPSVWLAVPFTFLGLVAEGGSSVSFIARLGVSRATEALMFGKKLTAEDLEKTGFVNKLFAEQTVPSFHASVRSHLNGEMEGLDPHALLTMKSLIKVGMREKNAPEAVNLRESYAQAEQMATGVPRKRFGQLSRKEIRHKL